MNNFKMIDLGQFEVTCNKIVVSDPCYNYLEYASQGSDWVHALIENVCNGQWIAKVETADDDQFGWGNRVCRLYAVHAGKRIEDIEGNLVKDVCVDSGQMSIVNAVDFPTYLNPNYPNEYDNPDNFYGMVCTGTEKAPGHVFKGGCASKSGFGDGSYDLIEYRNDQGECVGVEIVFIVEGDDEEDYSDDFEVN